MRPAGLPGLRARLRNETAEAHRALEEALDLPGRLSRKDAVSRVLCGLRGFFAPAELSLERALGEEIMAGRHRLPALDADLRTLGVGEAAIAALPCCVTEARTRSSDAALGALYVLEGTRLGGRVIGRALAAQPWTPAGFSRFWNAGPDEHDSWQRFLALLENALDEQAVIEGAEEAFTSLEGWLRSVGATRERT